MKADRKRQKRNEKTQAAQKKRVTMIVVIVLAIGALAFAARSYVPSGNAASGSTASARDGFRRISVDELKPLFDRGEVTIIDVRTADQYAQSHIPGSLQIPLARVDGEAQYLPKDKLIVAYCSCPAEESSGQAAQILAYRGVTNVAALTGGIEAWQRRSWPIESGMPSR